MAGIINASINLSIIPKDKINDGKNGKYLPITIKVQDEIDNFGKQGYIIVKQSKQERDAKLDKIYLGNVEVSWTNGIFPEKPPRDDQPQPQAKPNVIKEDDLPF